MRIRRLAPLLLLFALISCDSKPGCVNALFSSRWKGQRALDFSLPIEGSGKFFVLSEENHDHPILLVFWATWCPACVEEIPSLNQTLQDYKDQGLKIAGINIEEEPELMESFLRDHPMNYPVLLDTQGNVASQFEVTGLPTMSLLAKGGEILYYCFSIPRGLDSLLTKETNG